MVHNIADGQGDEIVRTVPLLQAFLDFNPRLEAVVITQRPYLRSHPRLTAVPIGDRAAIDQTLLQPFDAVVDFFEPYVPELNHDLALEARLQEYVGARRPFLFAGSRKGHDHLFEQVLLDGRPIAESRGLDQQRAASLYEPTTRLIAELGLPLRSGEQQPVSGFVLTGADHPEARAAWRELLRANNAAHPVADRRDGWAGGAARRPTGQLPGGPRGGRPVGGGRAESVTIGLWASGDCWRRSSRRRPA